MFTLYWIAFAPALKPCRIGLLITHENGDLGAISVKVMLHVVCYTAVFKCRHATLLPACVTTLTRDDSQRRFLAQNSAAVFEQCCNHTKQCRNNAATLCCAKNKSSLRIVSCNITLKERSCASPIGFCTLC